MAARKETIKRAKSKGVLTSYSPTKGNATVFPKFRFDLVMALVDKEPLAKGAINHFVAKCMEGDYAVIDKDSMTYQKDEELRLEENYNFRTEVLRKIFLVGKYVQNVFLEIVKQDVVDSNGITSKKTKALNILDSSNVEAETKPNGDLLRLKSKIPDPVTGQYPTWDASEIVWIKFGDMTKGYAPVDLQALYETLVMKDYVRRYVAWLWKTGQYRLLYNPRAASDADIEDFISYLQKNEDDYQVPFIFKGELETKVLREIKETDSITSLLSYLDSQIMVLLRVPPVDVGVTDASGRSSADQQTNNLITSVTDYRKIVEDAISYDLFPKISKSKYLFRFGPADRFAIKQAYEIIQIMKSLNMEDDVCVEQLNDMGIFFKTNKVFKEPELVMGQEGNPRDKDMAPSRKGKGTGEGNKPQEEITTRPDQLAKQ